LVKRGIKGKSEREKYYDENLSQGKAMLGLE